MSDRALRRDRRSRDGGFVPEEKLRVGCVLSGLIEIGLSPMLEHEDHMQLDPKDLNP